MMISEDAVLQTGVLTEEKNAASHRRITILETAIGRDALLRTKEVLRNVG